MADLVSGKIVSGLIKSVEEEPTPNGKRVTVRRYDPDSSPPKLLSTDTVEIREDGTYD